MASFASLLVPGVSIPTPDHSWIGNAADSIVGGIDKYKQNKSFNNLADLIGQQPQGTQQAAQPQQGAFMSSVAPQQQAMTAPVGSVERGAPQGDVYQPFIDTVKTRITNPYGLAAVAATGRAESGFSSGNANRTWSDPSQSGQAGTAGGVMSWRGPRLQAMQAYAAQKGERLGAISPQTQAEFFLNEDPQLVQALNNAQSPEEAQNLMNNAWKFAGYDQPGGETARRHALAQNYAAQFRDQPNPAAAAIDAQAPGGMGSPMTDQAFDGRFGDTALPGQVAQGMGGLASALTEANAAGATPQPVADPVQTGAVQRDPLSTANAQPISTPPAQASAGFAGAPGIQPIPRGGVPIELIQTMLRDPNLREIGVKLWAQNVDGPKAGEPFQFVTLPDGTFARANQQTGQVEPLGNFGKNQEQFRVLTGDERRQYGIPENDQRIYQMGPNGQIAAVGGAGQTINVGNEVEARRGAAAQAGLAEDDPRYQGFILTGKIGKESEQDLTATDKKAILEADEMVMNAQGVLPLLNRALELNDQAYSGPGAGTRGMITGTFGSDAGEATLELDNVVTGQALGQLKAIFGGAPTEGERKILLDMSGSSSLPPSVRKGIFQRAMQAVERRMKTYQNRADDLRGGTFYKSGSNSSKGNRTATGVQWSIEE